MFAVVKTGGKQYRVQDSDVLRVEKLDGKKGDKVKLDQVLMTGTGKDVKVGAPLVSGASVEAEIMEQIRGDKVKIFKKKRRQNYRRTKGHRQNLTLLRITSVGGKAPAKKAAPKKEASKGE